MKVSVVVAVWNPGPYIHDLIESLRAQTLPAAEWEAVFVDDGSTDDTPALLDALTAETPRFRVVHAEHSGWPGRPRNVGIDLARGDYVFLADHDDRLAPDALERLTAFADEHGSDVVVGTMVGVGRSVPQQIFDHTLVDAQERPDLLVSSLTPQKLYRRALLVDRDIRFPEGVRRLEDHVFVVQAYLRAKRVSVYAESPIYYFVLRDDGQNASRRRIEWAGYFANAAEAIAVVDAEAPDERTRLVLRRRWLRIEALRRVRGAMLLKRGDDRAELVAGVRTLLERHYPQAEIDALTIFDRIAARLVLDGRDADLAAFATWEATVRVRPRVAAVGFEPGTLRVDLVADQRATVPRPTALADLPAGAPSLDEIASMEEVASSARVSVALRRGDDTVRATVTQEVRDGVLTAVARLPLDGLTDGAWTVRATLTGLQRIASDELTMDATRIPARRRGDGSARFEVSDRGRPVLRLGGDRSVVGRLRRRLRR